MALAIHAGQIEHQSFCEKVKHFFNKSYHRSEIEKVIEQLKQHPSIELADRLITHYAKDSSLNQILVIFDRQMASLRPQNAYLHPENIKIFEKWNKANLPVDIFNRCPRFATFLFDSNLVSQIKVTRKAAVTYNGQEPAILFEGRWMEETELYTRFEIKYSSQFRQPFLTEKRTGDVYTYLDNGQGLQKHHPYLSPPIPISTLSQDEYNALWNRASSFVRPEEAALVAEERELRNQDRPHVLQIITAIERRGDTNFHNAILNPRHVFTRLIRNENNEGHLYEFGLERGKHIFLPLHLNTTRLRSPEIRDYFPNDAMIVTSIPITTQEANAFYEFNYNHHQTNIQPGRHLSYHLSSHNCTVFVREACLAAGIDVPTEMTVPDIIAAIAPNWINKIGDLFRYIKNKTLDFLEKPLSKKFTSWVRKGCDKVIEIWYKFWQTVASVLLFPFRFIMGDAFGDSGLAFRRRIGQRFTPPLQNLKTYLDFRVHTPGRVKEWQSEQPSTVVFHKPVRLAI